MKIKRHNFKRSFKYLCIASFLFVACLPVLSVNLKAEDSAIEWFDRGNVQIGFQDKGILPNGNFRVSLKNEGQYDLDYEIKLSNSGLNNFTTKKTGLIGADKTLSDSIGVANIGEYTAQVNLYFKGHTATSAANYSQNYDFTVANSATPAPSTANSTISTTDNTTEAPTEAITASDVRTFNLGNVVISSPDNKINAGDKFRINIANNGDSAISYEVNVNDIKTGHLVKKAASTLNAKTSVETWAIITSPGSHRVVFNLLNPNDSNKLLSQRIFSVSVSDSGNPNKSSNEKAGTSGASQPTTHSTNGKVNPSLGAILKGIFQGTNDATLANLDSVNLLIYRILEYAFNFAGIVAFVMVLWAGRMFLNSYGSDEAAAMGKKTLTWALVGLCVIILSKALVGWIYTFFVS